MVLASGGCGVLKLALDALSPLGAADELAKARVKSCQLTAEIHQDLPIISQRPIWAD